jgi:CTP:phosphocholine cytidylyltransferase involved in choline phosphorylation for cell surface LPS epitopes
MSNSASPRTGVILAAGFGSRLAGTREETDLKPLTPVAGTPLLIRTLNSLERAGCSRAVIVVGYGMETVQAEIKIATTAPFR